jgi:hypothetical protein
MSVQLSVVSDDGGGVGSNIYSQYADPRNPDSWHHYNLENASMVRKKKCLTPTTRARLKQVALTALTESSEPKH